MYSFYQEAELWRRRKEDVAGTINRAGLPLVLFGSSPAIDASFLRMFQVPIHCICDNNPRKWGQRLWGLEVIGPDQLQSRYPAYNVLILVPFEHEIVPQLRRLPVPPTEIFRLDLYFEEAHTAEFFEGEKTHIDAISAGLGDQLSKDTFEAVIRYRITRDSKLLSRVALPRLSQYFPDSLDGTPFLGEGEIFADAGAFTGDTVEQFYRTVQGRCHSIYAFEPDGENYRRLTETTRKIPNITCVRSAVGDTKGEVRFSSEASSSKTDAAGIQVVPADTLDHLLEGVPVTYLKMDVEGMECPALRGAEHLLKTYRPKLAVCTYHSNSDMLRVPELILRINPDYKLYFRHYTTALVETVCYAL